MTSLICSIKVLTRYLTRYLKHVWPTSKHVLHCGGCLTHIQKIELTLYESCAYLISGPRISDLNHRPTSKTTHAAVNMSDRALERERCEHVDRAEESHPSFLFVSSLTFITSCCTVSSSHQPSLLSVCLKAGNGGRVTSH